MPVLMVITILGIAAFQYYWLKQAYEREGRMLERQTNMLFRETVGSLQASKIKFDKIPDHKNAKLLITGDSNGQIKIRPGSQRLVNMMNIMVNKVKDSGRQYRRDSAGTFIITESTGPDTPRRVAFSGRRERLMQFLFDVDSIQDSIKIKELDTAYARRLDEQNINVDYVVRRVATKENPEPIFNEVTVGFQRPITYRMDLGNTTGILLKRIATPILFSLFLLGFTILSFTVLYRNLLKQSRLADIKNEFISNITHELKTPIATVSVAIEALRSFNASLDAQRTKEYLDISANELQRLSLLVDKVLKLSMFEKKEIELRYETLDMKDLVAEVTSSMRLQFEKHHAEVTVEASEDTVLEGDRLHLVSVIFNLLDNALKYSPGQPRIQVSIRNHNDQLLLSVSDTGIGIPAEYQGKIFEKFFRVPTGNLHNAKGYGLGLSYVAHVINRHHGSIRVESEEGKGSKFLITLPRHRAKQ